MIIHDDIALWNVEALETHENPQGVLLARLPRNTRDDMNAWGQWMGQISIGAELRFVTEASRAKIYLMPLDEDQTIRVYRGAYQVSEQNLTAGVVNTVDVCDPIDMAKLFEDQTANLPEHDNPFAPNVWRILCGTSPVLYLGKEMNNFACRPPKREETPALRWLAHGSSITHANLDGYVFHAASALRLDVQNKGLGGACHLEPQVADCLAACDWDIATLELGINVSWTMPTDEFAQCATYLIGTLAAAKPDAPIGVIDIYPNFSTYMDTERTQREKEYALALDEIVAELGSENVFRIPANTILDDYLGLAADFLHPNNYGNARMGMNLATILKPHCDKRRSRN